MALTSKIVNVGFFFVLEVFVCVCVVHVNSMVLLHITCVKMFCFCPQELHSSVRTNNVETCLRLLSKGADPNYFHKVSMLVRILPGELGCTFILP